jgi:transcriptional antiterminator RfaH
MLLFRTTCRRGACSMSWIVAQTKPRLEQYVSDSLARAQQFETYCPMARVTKRHARQTTCVVEPLFARYLFVRDTGQIATIRRMHGVVSVIMTGDRPARVSDSIVDAIRSRETDGAIDIDVRQMFSKGEIVRVTKGPYHGMTAIYKHASGTDRACIMISALGSIRKATIANCDLETV